MTKQKFIELYGYNRANFGDIDNRKQFTSDLNSVIASEIERVMPSRSDILNRAKEVYDQDLNENYEGYYREGANWLKGEITKKLQEG